MNPFNCFYELSQTKNRTNAKTMTVWCLSVVPRLCRRLATLSSLCITGRKSGWDRCTSGSHSTQTKSRTFWTGLLTWRMKMVVKTFELSKTHTKRKPKRLQWGLNESDYLKKKVAGKVASTKWRLELSVNLNISPSLGSQNVEKEEGNGENLALVVERKLKERDKREKK